MIKIKNVLLRRLQPNKKNSENIEQQKKELLKQDITPQLAGK